MIPVPNAFPWKKLLLALMFVAIGFALGGWLTARHFEPQLAEANQALGEFRNAYGVLAEAAGRQNAAIEAERLAGEGRKKKAGEAARAASDAAQPHYTRAENILGLKPPPGMDPCAAARDAFDAELREERGKP